MYELNNIFIYTINKKINSKLKNIFIICENDISLNKLVKKITKTIDFKNKSKIKEICKGLLKKNNKEVIINLDNNFNLIIKCINFNALNISLYLFNCIIKNMIRNLNLLFIFKKEKSNNNYLIYHTITNFLSKILIHKEKQTNINLNFLNQDIITKNNLDLLVNISKYKNLYSLFTKSNSTKNNIEPLKLINNRTILSHNKTYNYYFNNNKFKTNYIFILNNIKKNHKEPDNKLKYFIYLFSQYLQYLKINFIIFTNFNNYNKFITVNKHKKYTIFNTYFNNMKINMNKQISLTQFIKNNNLDSANNNFRNKNKNIIILNKNNCNKKIYSKIKHINNYFLNKKNPNNSTLLIGGLIKNMSIYTTTKLSDKLTGNNMIFIHLYDINLIYDIIYTYLTI